MEQISVEQFKAMNRKSKHKFNAVVTERNGIKFDSKKEARYYDELCIRPDVVFFLRQVPFDLPGGVKYRVDFQVFLVNGDIEFIDVKGYETKDFKMKKKMVEAQYPVEIKTV